LNHNGSPGPIFYTDPERLSFSTTIFIHPKFIIKNEEINEEIKDNEHKILRLIQCNPTMTIQQLKVELNVSKITIERLLNSLKEKRLIERKGSCKSGKWIVNK
jgi:predicted HTH transcriptional regulator